MEEGAVVGNYLLGRRIGEGAQASVFQARHRFLDRQAAVKVLKPQSDPLFRDRFLREARATASLEHPGIVRVLDCGIEGDVLYMAMELLLGVTLKELNVSRASGGYSLEEVMSVMMHAADALALAHACGIVHRDLKPSNVFMLGDGSLKLLDFGVAKVVGSDLTRTGDFFGNISYAPFEQWRNSADVTPASDIYSVGAIAFEMIVGRLPPRSDLRQKGVSGPSSELPAGSSLLRRGVPEPITNLLVSCLDENPDLRPQNAEELLRRLQPLASGHFERKKRGAQPRGQGRLAEALDAPSRTWTQYSQVLEPSEEVVVHARQGWPRTGARFAVLLLAAAAVLVLIVVKARAPVGATPAAASVVAIQPARQTKPEPRPPAPAAPPAALTSVKEFPLRLVAAPGFPPDALEALRQGLAKKAVLTHGGLDLPSDGDWFLFWSDRTLSRSAHLPPAFVAHMSDREQLKTIVRPEFAVDGSWLILTSEATLFRSDSFPEDVFSARAAHGSSSLSLFEMVADDADGDLSGAPSISLYSDGHAMVTNDDSREIQGAVSRASLDGGGIVDVIVEPGGEWMIIGTRSVAMSRKLDPGLRQKVQELEAAGATVCQAVEGRKGRWALIIQEAKGVPCLKRNG
ncbi:MAG TPA: serine/threonine-protein kinase [Polyangia bacterium]|nr:serine/threonine-protein kinase [Polyangia bacterium]